MDQDVGAEAGVASSATRIHAPETLSDDGPSAPGILEWSLLALLVVIWGSAFAAIRIAVVEIPPVWLVAGRMWVAFSCLAMVAVVAAMAPKPAWVRSLTEVKKPTLKAVALYSLIGTAFTALPFTFYASAGQTVGSAVLAICNGGAPVFTALFAHLLVAGERLTTRRTLGVVLGFAGLAILVAPQAQDGLSANFLGLALAIGGTALYAGGNITARRAPAVSAVMSSMIVTASGGLAATIAALAMEAAPEVGALSVQAFLAALFLGAFPTAAGTFIWMILVRRVGPMFVVFATFLTPLWAAFLGVAFLGEALALNAILALALVLGGVAIANSRRRRKPGGA